MSRIIKLEVENFKRLEAVSIEPDGNVIVIGGPNGAGKSSTLDAIEEALGGKKHVCERPLHEGAEAGFVIVETEEYTITRRYTPTDNYIEVKNKEGFKAGSPQALLDKWVGDLSFDPLAFVRMETPEKVATLMRILKLDFSELDSEYAHIEEERLLIGREGKSLKAQLDAIPLDPTAPTAEVVVSDLVAQLEQARETNEANEKKRARVTEQEYYIKSAKDAVAKAEQTLRDAREELAKMETGLANYVESATGLVDIDTAPIMEAIDSAESINRRVRAAAQRAKLKTDYEAKAEAYKTGTTSLEEIKATKAAQIADAKFPVDGVTFGDDGILVNGIPFSQASSAEQLKIAVAMGLSANPELRVILIRDGSLLDETSMAAMQAMADQYGAQVFLECVSDGKECQVVIREGREGPKVFQDGDKWCALLGDDLQAGQAAFGDTKAEALAKWNEQYRDKPE